MLHHQSHVQRERHHTENDPIPQPKEYKRRVSEIHLDKLAKKVQGTPSKLQEAILLAKAKVSFLPFVVA